MAVTSTTVYGGVVALTITLASLANSATAGRQSTVVDNTSDVAIDSIVQVKVTTGTTPTNGNLIQVWAFGTADGTNYSGGAGTTDAGFTPTNVNNMRLLESFTVTSTSNITYVSGSHSIANAFGGTMPRKWGIFVLNNSGVALNATAGNHSVQYSPVKYQSA
jgi:hypothetical protein